MQTKGNSLVVHMQDNSRPYPMEGEEPGIKGGAHIGAD